MGSTVFALLLFGCADDGTACQQLSAEPRYYDSQAMCEADLTAALQSQASLRADHPSVVARCIATKELAALERSSLDLRDGRFDPQYASALSPSAASTVGRNALVGHP